MGRWSKLPRRDLPGRALGAVASFHILPRGAARASELLQPLIKFAPSSSLMDKFLAKREVRECQGAT